MVPAQKSGVEAYDDGASMVVPFAIVARSVAEVSMARATGTALVAHLQVGGQIDVRERPAREMQVRAFEGGVSMRGAIIVVHGMAVRLRTPMPIPAISGKKMGADHAAAAMQVLVVAIRMVDDVPVAARIYPHKRILHVVH